MTAPQVSVVMPTRDRWPRLQRTLAYALAQEDVDLEVVITDDASRDGTAERLEALGDARVRVLRNETSNGGPAARSKAIAQARGEWIAFLDDDDLWAPDKLRCQLDAAARAGAAWAYCGAVTVDASGTVIDVDAAPPPDELSETMRRYSPIPAGGSNIVVRATLLREVGGIDATFTFVDDWDLHIRLLLAGTPAACPELLIAYVQHDSNMSVRHADVLERELERLRRKHAGTFELDGVMLSRLAAGSHRHAGDRVGAARAYLRGALRFRNAGNLVRGAGALLGERAIARFAPARRRAPLVTPPWLER